MGSPGMTGEVIFTAAGRFAREAAEWIARAIAAAAGARGSCALALAGGSTPKSVYACLARPPLKDAVAWDALSVYFGDERCVGPDHPDSNYRMAREALLEQVPVRPDQVYRIRGEEADRVQAALAYDRLLPERLYAEHRHRLWPSCGRRRSGHKRCLRHHPGFGRCLGHQRSRRGRDSG